MYIWKMPTRLPASAAVAPDRERRASKESDIHDKELAGARCVHCLRTRKRAGLRTVNYVLFQLYMLSLLCCSREPATKNLNELGQGLV
jgi:hypothetical protein